MARDRRIVAIALAGVALAAIAIAVLYPRLADEPVPPAGRPLAAAPGGPFSLIDHTGRRVSDADYRGVFMLVFFGYTFCPDVCPTTLNDIGRAMEMLGDKAARVRPLFVTVDPARDTPAVLARYVEAFDAGITGLTGSAAAIDRAARAYRVPYARSERGAEGDDDYLVEHGAYVYLMGPDGNYLTHFAYGIPPERMAREIARRIDGAR